MAETKQFGRKTGLDSRQKTILACLARTAWEQGGHRDHAREQSAAADPFGLAESDSNLFNTWRHIEAMKACGKRISEASTRHFLPLQSHFLALKNGAIPEKPASFSLETSTGGTESRTFCAEKKRQGWKIHKTLSEMRLPWAYVDGMAYKMFGVDRVEWCQPDALRAIIAALIYHQSRHK
jgi:hypothetical protein